RLNVVRIDELPAGGAVDSLQEPASASLALTPDHGRYTRIWYEPLFNQVRAIERGVRIPDPTRPGSDRDSPLYRRENWFDYQELAPTLNDLQPLLGRFVGWGFGWLHGSNGLDLASILSWQLPLPFLGGDINGDGAKISSAEVRGSIF